MVRIDIQGEYVVFEVLGWHKLWACASRVKVEARNIVSVRLADPDEALGWGISGKVLGTNVPNRFFAGTFTKDKRLYFLDVKNAGQSIAVELAGEKFYKAIVEVADPFNEIARLSRIIPRT